MPIDDDDDGAEDELLWKLGIYVGVTRTVASIFSEFGCYSYDVSGGFRHFEFMLLHVSGTLQGKQCNLQI